MKKIKNFSFVLIVSPILFTGCMQEKIANISPPKPNQDNLAIYSKQQTKLSSNTANDTIYSTSSETNLTNYNEYYDLLVVDENDTAIIDQLLKLHEEFALNKSNLKENSFEAQSSWQEITKEEEIIATAMAYLDTKYLWAANGPNAFDCSGFTRYVFKENGITLPRYSGHQAKVGIKVSFDELQKGDLVFFDTEKKYTKRVNHVGIYIGDNKFIHASSAKKKVIITSFKKKHFYKNRFLWGRRIIDDRNIAYNSI